MKDFAADDLEAADLLALARLDDDGAPPAATRPRPASAPGPARVPADPVTAVIAGWGQGYRAEHDDGRR
jgi:hypothetical protein